MKSSVCLLLLCSSVLFFSSCASVFEGRNYTHLHYVKVKKEHPEIAQSNPVQKDDVPSMVSKEEHRIAIAEPPAPSQKKLIPQGYSDLNRPQQKANPSQQNQAAINLISAVLKNPAGLLLKKEQNKMESKNGELFGRLDPDLKIALIFGIAGVVLLFFTGLADPAGTIFAIAASVLIIIALVYLIKYLVENG